MGNLCGSGLSPEQAAENAARRSPSAAADDVKSVKDDYVLAQQIGEGAWGVTHLATSRATGEEVAVKRVSKRKLRNTKDVENVRAEVEVQRALTGQPHIVALRDAYEDKLEFALVMELCAGGELFDRIIARHHYTEKDACELTRAMLVAVERMHANGVAHRDLKPENFLFLTRDEDAELKLTDFGLSQFFKAGETFPDVCGTAYYVAPEVLVGRGEPKSDVWSVGVLAYILLSGEPPFNGRSDRDIFRAIHSGSDKAFKDRAFRGRQWSKVSRAAKDAIIRMCLRDPKKRPSAAQMLEDPWVTGAKARDKALSSNVISKMANFSRMNRLKKVTLMAMGEGMSTEEQAELRAAFQALDANGDGELSVDELREGLGTADKAGALGVHGEKLLKALQAMDIDGNGSVNYNEWLASTMAVRKLTNEAAIRSAFEKFDANGDGRISRDEIAKALANAGEQTDDAELAQILREADTDNSGDIDFNEFLTHMRREREAHGNDPIGLPRQLPKSAYQAGAE